MNGGGKGKQKWGCFQKGLLSPDGEDVNTEEEKAYLTGLFWEHLSTNINPNIYLFNDTPPPPKK